MKFMRIMPAILFLSAAVIMVSPGFAHPGDTPQLRLTAPNGGEVLLRGKPAMITWTSSGMPAGAEVVLVLYHRGIKTVVICRNCPDKGRFQWLIPAGTEPGAKYRIRIRWTSHPEINDFSDADFQIRDNGH